MDIRAKESQVEGRSGRAFVAAFVSKKQFNFDFIAN